MIISSDFSFINNCSKKIYTFIRRNPSFYKKMY